MITIDGGTGVILNNGVEVASPKQFDEWRLSADQDLSNSATLTSWERSDTNFDLQGTGMSHSSGIFTFPTTGKYLVNCMICGRRLNHDQEYVGNIMHLSTDSGSSYSITAAAWANADSSNAHFVNSISKIIDVTNASTFRLYVRTNTTSNDVRYFGDTDENRCTFQFIRLCGT